MSRQRTGDLRTRVEEAAEACLQREPVVGPLELLQELRWLHPVHVESWRKGHPAYPQLEEFIQCGPEKLRRAYEVFAAWVQQRGLVPVETPYQRSGRGGVTPLQVTCDGDPERERFFRTRFVPSDLPERQQQRVRKKLEKPPDLVVFILVSEQSDCAECQAPLFRGDMLFMEAGQPLCLSCADLDHLEFLPSGDAAMSRRARKHSPLSAIVVRFSRARKRYERKGLLATPEAIAQAADECAADADDRAERRQKDGVRRQEEDRELIAAMAQTIRERYPGCPADEAGRIAAHTAIRGSGRVGRSAAGRTLDPQAIDLAVIAWIRHQHTRYDSLLMSGTERREARILIRDDLDRVRDRWAAARPEDLADAARRESETE